MVDFSDYYIADSEMAMHWKEKERDRAERREVAVAQQK